MTFPKGRSEERKEGELGKLQTKDAQVLLSQETGWTETTNTMHQRTQKALRARRLRQPPLGQQVQQKVMSTWVLRGTPTEPVKGAEPRVSRADAACIFSSAKPCALPSLIYSPGTCGRLDA